MPEIAAALPAVDQTFYSHSIKMSKQHSPLLRFPLPKGLAAGDATAITKAHASDATQTLRDICPTTQVTAQNDSPPPQGHESPWMESSIHLLTKIYSLAPNPHRFPASYRTNTRDSQGKQSCKQDALAENGLLELISFIVIARNSRWHRRRATDALPSS